MAETRKLKERWLKEGVYSRYIKGFGVDVGCGRLDCHDGVDLICPTVVQHDKDVCNAETIGNLQRRYV